MFIFLPLFGDPPNVTAPSTCDIEVMESSSKPPVVRCTCIWSVSACMRLQNMGRVAVAAAVSLWLIPISILVDRIFPDPYMAQKYCRGNFKSWDPMITIPPGLQLSRNKMFSFFQFIVALTICFLSVKIFSIAHPYLLADNRHYPFYLWRKVINYHWSTKYLMVALYVYSMSTILTNLAKGQKKIWLLVYILVCAGTLIPTPLVGFRYYTVPFYFLILHTCIDDNKSWLIRGTIYLAINCFTMFMFLFRPFSWSTLGHRGLCGELKSNK